MRSCGPARPTRCNGEVFNVGGAEPISHRDLVELLIEMAGSGTRALRRMAAGEEGDRHRQLLLRFDANFTTRPAGARESRCGKGCGRTVDYYREHSATTSIVEAESVVIPFLQADARRGRRPQSATAIDACIARGWFVLGPELEAFEAEFAAACGAPHAVGVGNGTDAIALALRALGIGPGDEVITSPLSAAYTALAIMMAGARPVFADIDPDRLTIDPAAVAAAVTPRTAAILPVHLYGQPADMAAIEAVARAAQPRASSRTAARRISRRAPDGRRHASASPARSVSIRPRISARSATAARVTNDGCGAGGARAAAAQRRSDRPIPPRRVRRELAARRDAGGDTPRAAAVPAAAGPSDAARWRRGTATLLARAAITVPPEHDAGHVYHLFPVRSESASDPGAPGAKASKR